MLESNLEEGSPPDVSVVIVSRNSLAELKACLGALEENAFRSFEVIVVIDASADPELTEYLKRSDGVQVEWLDSILGYAYGWNRGAEVSRGRAVLFLKDDTVVEREAIGSSISCLDNDEVGVVGAMLLNSEGVLIEAGSCVGNDGRCRGIGRGWNPDDFRVQFRRNVAFCSASYLGVDRELFESVGGFDESYHDEYYEDVDLCLKVQNQGKRVVYDPGSRVVRTLEFRDGWDSASAIMDANRGKFAKLARSRLNRLPALEDSDIELYFERVSGRRLLWIEDSPPFAHMGAGFPRTLEMLTALLELGHRVTLLPTFMTTSDFVDVYRDAPREVEVALGIGKSGFDDFWKERAASFDTVIISRPNNLKDFGQRILDTKNSRPDLAFIYDAEAIFVNREISERRSQGNAPSRQEEIELLEAEVSLAKRADAVFAISEGEKVQFESIGVTDVTLLRHHSPIVPTSRSFEERKDILFVGAVHSDTAPNALGLIDFIENALPEIRSKLGSDIKLYCAGRYHSESLLRCASDSEIFLGFVEDLDEWYDRCRLFIAPAKYAAGIPLKIIEASSKGIPVVGSELAREQLGWSLDEMLSGDSDAAFASACVQAYSDKTLWERLRSGALERIRADYGRDAIVDALKRALD